MNGIGLQLYTLRDALAKDLPGTLKRVAAIGYKHVEAFSFGQRDARGVEQAIEGNRPHRRVPDVPAPKI